MNPSDFIFFEGRGQNFDGQAKCQGFGRLSSLEGRGGGADKKWNVPPYSFLGKPLVFDSPPYWLCVTF